MAQKILICAFYLLFALTPLFWAPWNFELFEYNKMMLVYFFTTTVAATWAWKMISQKKLIFQKTPLDLPLLLFFLANILSTLFSIDPHTSWWGYYSRSNGGLLSLVSYLLLYYALVSNFEGKEALRFLKAALWGGVLVSLWAIPEHFGVSPSCFILTKELSASCWVQDVQARVFATLGQPNWLAAYLGMLIFPALYFFLTSTKRFSILTFAFCLLTFYLAFTFTYSRGVTLGLLAGLVSFLLLNLHGHLRGGKLNLAKPLLLILSVFAFINLIFGSALTDFKLLSKFAPPPRPSLTEAAASKPTAPALESGGTESGKIRLIVWRGAWEIFKHYPIFGSGVETFAHAYYNFRPPEHNLVSEWDFLYNKAHNEFLNYLATTGIVGLGTYFAVILTFIIWSLKTLTSQPNSKFYLLTSALLASYTLYLVQNFFGFSVVVTALLFYLFPALTFLATNSLTPQKSLPFKHFLSFLKPLYHPKLAQAFIVTLAVFFTYNLFQYYLADIYFAKGEGGNNQNNPETAFNNLLQAATLNPGEPYYRSELGYASALTAFSLAESESTASAQFQQQAISETGQALKTSPRNMTYLRTAIRTYYLLSALDSNFTEKVLQILEKSMTLAPTDAKLSYNKGLILSQIGKNQEAAQVLEATLKLKPNFREAYILLGETYQALGEKEKAVNQAKTVLKLIPDDPEVLEKLAEWEK